MNIDRLDWDTLRVFRVVAERLSMSAASARLGESPPTISRKIDELEKSLGAAVFVRTRRGVQLTEAGQKALSHVQSMAKEIELMGSQSEPSTSLLIGSITLRTGDGLGPYWIAPRLKQFHNDNPKVQVKMIVGDAVPDLHGDDADIAISFSATHPRDVIAYRLGVQHYVGFASPEYLKEFGTPNSFNDYHKHRCILHTSYASQVERWAPRMSEMRKMVDFAFVTNSGTAIAESCAKGGGIGILPSYMSLLDPRLVALALPEIAPVQFWINYTERVRRLPHGMALIAWIRRLFELPEALWFADEFVHPRDYAEKVRELHPQVRRTP